MAERVVTLKINVTDNQVEKAEVSMKRLKKAAEDVGRTSGLGGGDSQRDGAINAAAKRLGISYDEMAAKVRGASGATKQASTAIAETGEVAASTGGRIASLAGRVGAVGAAFGAVIVVIGAVIAAAIKLGQQIFSLAESFAKYASEIKQSQEATGLALDTVVALRQEADATGRSFESTVVPAVNKFREQIGKAAAGSEEARRSLNLLGIDGRRAVTDIDGAFKTAVSAIANAKTPFDQVRLAAAAFGAEGVKLIPFIREFRGDIDALKRRAEELGIQIGGKNVQQADAFNRAYSELRAVVKGITNTFGSEFLPMVTGVLRDFGGWLVKNKEEIKSWAVSAGQWVQYLIDKFRDVQRWRETLKAQEEAGMNDKFPELRRYRQQGNKVGGFRAFDTPPGPPLGGAPVDANNVYGTPTSILTDTPVPDNQAIFAAWEEQQRKRKAAMEEAARQAKQLADFIRDLEQRNINFGDSTEVTATRVRLLAMGIKDLTSGAALYALQVAAGIDKKRKEAEADRERKKALEDYQKAFANEKKQVAAAGFGSVVDARTQLNAISEQVRLGRELTDVEQAIVQYQGERLKYTRQLQDSGFTVEDIEQLLSIKDAEQERVEAILKQIQAKKDLIAQQEKENKLLKQYNDYTASLEDQIDVLARGGRELSVFEQVQRDIVRNYGDWTDAQKENALELARQIDLLEELNRQHAELKDFFKETFTYVFEGDFEGLFDSFRRRVVDSFTDRLSEFLATNILGFDPKATNNPVAKPIVSKLDETNKLLSQIVRATGQVPAANGIASIGGFGSILGGLFGGGGSGMGPGGTPWFNPNASGGGRAPNGSIITLPNGEQAVQVNAGGGGGFFSNLRNLFSTGEGGIFAPRTNELTGRTSRLGGILGGAGDLAAMVGGMIGGRVGGVISMAGTGMSIGAMFGPWGALIGGIGGAIAGLFMGDPKRKRDQKEKMPALAKGFAEAIAELRRILEDVRFLRVDPGEAESRANEVRAQIAGGFGIQFESKKYRKQAQQQIASRLTEADAIIAQIREAAAIARGAADRRQRILPEFAGGHYFADYFKPNGLLPGMFDGRDDIFALISRGEMVLNPTQQRRVRGLAGFDVFAGAGIPNYPNASPSPKLAMGGIAGTGLAMQTPAINFNPNLTLVLQGVTFERGARAWLESDDGRRTLVKVTREERQNRAV